MHKTRIKNLKKLTGAVLTEMEKAHYCDKYIKQVRSTCMLLENMADRMDKDTLDDELSQAFIDDSAHFRTGAYSKSRFKRHRRCIHILRTYRETGASDWPSLPHAPVSAGLTAPQLIKAHALFARRMGEEIGLKKNTIDGYKRFVYYFLVDSQIKTINILKLNPHQTKSKTSRFANRIRWHLLDSQISLVWLKIGTCSHCN